METGQIEFLREIRHLRRTGKLEQAQSMCEAELSGNTPLKSLAYLQLARIAKVRGDHAEERRFLDAALQVDAHNRAALFTLVRFLVREKDEAQAIQFCDLLLEIDRVVGDFAFSDVALSYRAYCLYKQGRLAAARTDLRRTKVQPSEPILGASMTFGELIKRLAVD